MSWQGDALGDCLHESPGPIFVVSCSSHDSAVLPRTPSPLLINIDSPFESPCWRQCQGGRGLAVSVHAVQVDLPGRMNRRIGNRIRRETRSTVGGVVLQRWTGGWMERVLHGEAEGDLKNWFSLRSCGDVFFGARTMMVS